MPRLRSLLAALALAAAAGWPALPQPLQAAPASVPQLQALEAALNSGSDLAPLLEAAPGFDPSLLELRRRALVRQFPDARWQLRPGTALRGGRPTVLVTISGSRSDGPTQYRLEASQLLTLESSGSRINGQTVVREQSMLRSGEALPVRVQIPDAVLTGQRYDVDVLFEEPLDGAVAAGGIMALTPQQVAALDSPDLQLGALGGGGLFKTVQAPLTPGSQTWAVLLVHPDGIVSTTKRVRVVADRSQLNP
ncbi:MAG: hypothetical protein ACKO7Z_10485 [Cyanobacteriota bacterium]